ncbi:helix-turn-helix domain-containing protein [Rhodococcus sp. KBS0724]|uniref:helix-turn-helix domain-containing protein n=1 Tax=Rhodococcus sp. KBS0724 TaxID=1179674 RepID=UPI0021B0EDB7|nr:helix-turn-helix domain-containing protein [Rhodococcus sp. KBS0724]
MSQPRRSSPTRSSPMPETARIGDLFAERRVQLRLTQQTLANLAGVSRSSVQALEYGTGSVKLASIVEIADALGLRLQPITIAEVESPR